MASNNHHPWQCPSFFKVMIGPDFARTVRIPPLFKKHLGESFGGRAVLRRPRGREWAVVVGNVDGDLSFREGWECFVADNAVSFGEFLIFVYRGDAVFDVAVYGTSGCRRGDAVPLPPPSEVKIELETLEEASPEVPGKRNRKRSGREKSPPASDKKRGRAEWRNSKLLYEVTIARDSRGAGGGKAMEAACSFKTTRPHLIVTCRDSRSKFLPIPAQLDRLLNLGEKPSVILRDAQGRAWEIKISSWRDGRRCLASSWSDVYKKNCLKEGDVCLLEFVQGNEINLHIFPGEEPKEESALGKRLLTSAKKERALKEANSFKSKNPKFVAVWRSSLLYYVNIPQKVVKELDLKESQHGKILDPNGRFWPVEITCRQRGRVDMGSGWNNFVKGNELHIGDACVIEFTRGVEEIQVHIFSGQETNITPATNTSAVVRNTSAAMGILEESPDRKSDVIFF
ncbi:B3 domain-containing protein-like [Iris pallida]|uniref:B3 domain-containing protein-like n=1 Tax=Iris pallida TaxID=29817 RepID=A0AAX6I588_IRIPA|nr:B3 domain-containing protein-like [Iris pallida]